MELWKDPQNIIFWLAISLLIFLILLTFIIALINITYKKSVEKKEILFEEKIRHEKLLQNAIIQVQDQERKHIASELHDQVSNKLNLVLMMLGSAESQNHNQIQNLKSEIRKIIDKNRDISHYLFPVEIENIGLFFTLQDLMLKYKTQDFCIQLYCNEVVKFQCKQEELHLYRVIQECLTNVLKHSKASIFSIHFRLYKNKKIIVISDNGIGYDKNKITRGLGSSSIDTRLHSIHAKFKFKSELNKGTRLIIVL